MDEEDLLSEKVFKDFYSEKGFSQVWIRSYLSAHSIILHLCFVIISIVTGILIKINYPFSFRSYISMFSDIILTYSSTIIGFLLVSFSILLSISNVRNNFKYFVENNKVYNRPLLKVILDHFIFPIGVFLLLLILSLLIKLFNGFCLLSGIDVGLKAVLFRGFIGIYVFLVLLSITELVSYFFNMYRFIVITSLTISREYEEEILTKIYVTHEHVDILNQDDANLIRNYQEQKKAKVGNCK